jgi:hypothetical protein
VRLALQSKTWRCSTEEGRGLVHKYAETFGIGVVIGIGNGSLLERSGLVEVVVYGRHAEDVFLV